MRSFASTPAALRQQPPLGAACLLGSFAVVVSGCGATTTGNESPRPGTATASVSDAGLGPDRTTANAFDAGTGEPEGLDCSLYRDEPGSASFEVELVNARSGPIFVAGTRCVESRFAYLQFSRGGEPVSLEEPTSFEFPCIACSEGATDGCNLGCQNHRLVRIDPGGRFALGPFASESVAMHAVPESCVPRAIGSEGSCHRKVPLAAGEYQVGAFALTSLCSMAANASPEDDCSPGASGACETRYLCTSTTRDTADINARTTFRFPDEPVVTLRFEE